MPDSHPRYSHSPLDYITDKPLWESDLEPRPAQIVGAQALRFHKRYALWDVPGKGKSLMAYMAHVPPMMWSGSSIAVAQAWDWWMHHAPPSVTSHCYLATGEGMNKAERTAVLIEAHRDPLARVFINHEMLRPVVDKTDIVAGKIRPHTTRLSNKDWEYEYPIPPALSMVFDEAHWLRGHTAWRAKGAVELARSVPYVFELTATPKYTEADDFYQQLRILRPQSFTSYWRFVDQWCRVWNNGYGKQIIGMKNDAGFLSFIGQYGLMRGYEPGELPPNFELDTIMVEPTPATKRRLKVLHDEYRDGDAIYTSASAMVHAHQRLSSSSTEKLDALCEWVSNNHRRFDGSRRGVLCLVHLKDTAELVAAALRIATDAPFTVITGDMPAAKRITTVNSAANVVATIDCLSESINATHMTLVPIYEEQTIGGMDWQGWHRSVRPRYGDPRILANEPVLIQRFMLRHSGDKSIHDLVTDRIHTTNALADAMMKGD